MVIPPPPPLKSMSSKLPPPIPKHAALPWNPALSHPVQETGSPPQAVHDSQGTEQDGAQPPPPEGSDDGWSDDEKENHPVQETEPASEALDTPQVVGQDEVITDMDDVEAEETTCHNA